ncbi:ERI1 exoribonuclease 3 isoform X2 [Ailuropoda melanoleuca]|uniref:ERI1 exoribonuclease 3 isoform X2 n=1 Tax=Ailuropoda melanoleuca TaxID=9646 RepID=UPI0014944170|nr:ERI1 exoribonuclease 3 isoform X2 [Ailuropoda melanoleuca]
MATASPAADGGRGRPWEGGLVSWPPAPPLTLPWTWMGPSWGQHPGHWGFPALTEPSASPAGGLGIFEVRRDVKEVWNPVITDMWRTGLLLSSILKTSCKRSFLMWVRSVEKARPAVLDASGCSMLAPLQTGAARFSSYLLSRARKVLGSHLFSPCGVPEFCSISTRKLAAHGFGASMAAMVPFPPQRYHYFLVLDFEATCDKPQIHPQEIIEFPILKLNGRTMEIESTFHMYVQPVVHPQLTPFCTELTGIIQAMVDGQPSLQQVLERVDEWMAKEGLLDPNVKSIFVTCGDWDLKVMLPGQCQYLGLPVADYFKQWINLKKAYSFAMGCWPKNGLLDMNKGLSLQHIGRPHSGIEKKKPRHREVK